MLGDLRGQGRSFLGHVPNLIAEPVTFEVAREAARIRAATAVPTRDALILGTGHVTATDNVVSNDGTWRTTIARAGLSLTVCHLDAHRGSRRTSG